MGSQSFQLGDLVGPGGPVVLVGRVDNSASLQMGRGESRGAIPEVQVVGHLVDPGVSHPMDPEVGRLVDPEVGHLVDLEVGHLKDQVVGSSHSGHQEVDPVGVDRLDRHGSLGQSKTLG